MRPGGTEEQKYFNPRSPHGERRNPTGSGISERHFNPRSPHGERPALTAAVSSGEKFQSTLPARGATLRADGSKSGYTHFNPRSPHGERQVILIVWACASLFQSTLPARGATHQGVLCRCKVRKISIHAPRTGSDLRWLRTARRSLYFNPRSPHGERLFVKPWFYAEGLFQSTLPARGATATSGAGTQTKEISIHAPRTGSDGGVSEHHRAPLNFNPRSPHGERLLCVYDKSQNINFNPRSPHGERPHQGRRDL